MTIPEVAQLLGFTTQKIYRLITSKKLIAHLIKPTFSSSYYEIKPKDLEFFLLQFAYSDYDCCPLTCLINLSD